MTNTVSVHILLLQVRAALNLMTCLMVARLLMSSQTGEFAINSDYWVLPPEI